MKGNKILLIILTLIACVVCTIILSKKRSNNMEKPNITENPIIAVDKNMDFDFKMIKETHNRFKNNYMISPLSIAYALNLLKEGASDNTLKEINNVLNNYNIPDIIDIKNRISIANLLFVNEIHKKDISNDYINTLKTKYNSDLLFDPFNSPDNINNWVKTKTFDMIPKALDTIDPSTVLGLANAIAIDVEWKNKFECPLTTEKTFTKIDKTIMKTAMMHSSDDAYYIESKNARGIIKDYVLYDKTTGEKTYTQSDNTIALEYIAILPEVSIDQYMSIFDENELKTLINSKQYSNDSLSINYALPKYTYDFDYLEFKQSLINLGIHDAFANNANFKKMLNEDSTLNIYVNEAIHKSHIELSENGTKAAAVTMFLFKDSAMIEETPKKVINIEFDKPFIYIIKEKNSDNIWFFGTVYEPIKWEDNPKCEIE